MTAAAAVTAPAPTVYFDGHCALCSGFVRALLRRDRRGALRFAPLQSAYARTRLAAAGIDADALDSVAFVDDAGRAYVRSEAFFAIMSTLGAPYRYLGALRIVPRGLRDWVYDRVAATRYRVFGRHEACWLPRPEWRGRFLGEDR